MINIMLTYEDGQKEKLSLETPFLIGRSADCALRIQHWRVAKTHVRIREDDAGCHVEDLGSLSGTRVNGQRIVRYGPVQATDEVIVGPCLIRLTTSQIDRAAQDIALHSLGDVSLDSVHLSEPESGRFRREIRKSLHLGLIKVLDLRRTDIAALTTTGLRDYARACARQVSVELLESLSDAEREELIELVVSEAIGLGVLEPLLADPTVSEIMVNAFDEIYVERGGRLARAAAEFSSEIAVRGIIERIVFPLGRRIDELSPMVDARLPDGSRLNAVIAPIALSGSCVTIRKINNYTLIIFSTTPCTTWYVTTHWRSL